MRIVVANDPLAYRDVIGSTVRVLRPDVDVIAVAPDELETAVLDYLPDLVVCSRLTSAVVARVRAWIMLYPDGASSATISVDGERTTVADIDFPGVLAAIDRAAPSSGRAASPYPPNELDGLSRPR